MLSGWFLGCFLVVFRFCLGDVWVVSWRCLVGFLVVFRFYFGDVRVVSRRCLVDFLVVSWFCLVFFFPVLFW